MLLFPEVQAIFLNPFNAFAHRANRSLSFVCLFTKKQTEVTHLQDQTDLPIYA
jgi:hypothetical protein